MRIDSTQKSTLKSYLKQKITEMQRGLVTIITPYPLEKESLHILQSNFPRLSQVQIENVVDKSILGGYVLIDGSTIIDASVKGKLEAITATLLQH